MTETTVEEKFVITEVTTTHIPSETAIIAENENAGYKQPDIRMHRKTTYNTNYTDKPMEPQPRRESKAYSPPKGRHHRKTSTYVEDYPGKMGEKRDMIVPQSDFVPPDDHHGHSTNYNSEFSEKPMTTDRKQRPSKPYEIPHQKMRRESNYKEDFPEGVVGEKRTLIKPQSDYQPPNDGVKHETNYNAEFNTEKKIDVDRKRQPFQPYSHPAVQMRRTSNYNEDFVHALNDSERTQPIRPKSDFVPPNDPPSKIETSYRSSFAGEKPLDVDRRRQPYKEYQAPTESMRRSSNYKDDFSFKVGDRRAPIIPQSEFYQPDDAPLLLETNYQSTFTGDQPGSVAHHRAPHKPYTKPSVKVEDKTMYARDFVAKPGKRTLAIVPHQEFVPPNDKYEMKSNYKAAFTEKQIAVDRRHQPFKPFHVPEIKMEDHTTYGEDFEEKTTARASKCIPIKNSWFKMAIPPMSDRTEYASKFQLIDEQAMRDARMEPFRPSHRHLHEDNDPNHDKTVHTTSFVQHTVTERSAPVIPPNNDFHYKMHPSETEISVEVTKKVELFP